MDKDKYDEGYVACIEGFDIADVPYNRGSYERACWLEGFCAAQINENE
jgi:hypothetical protein